MAVKKAEIEPEIVHKSQIQFADDENSEDFHDENADENAIEAEIENETKFTPAQKEELPQDEFSQFLANLPENEEIKFMVTRLADRNLAGKFRLPCLSNETLDTIYWNGETDPTEIYSQITRQYGGGQYRIQSRANKGFIKEATWTITLGDPAKYSEKEKLIRAEKEEARAKEQPRNIENSQAFVNPQKETGDDLDKLILLLEKNKKLNELIAPPLPPQAQIAQPAQSQLTKESIKMLLIEKALTTGKPELVEMTVRSAFDIPPDNPDEEPKGIFATIAHGISTAIATNPTLQNKLGDVISGVVEGGSAIVGNLIMPKQAPAQTPAAPINLNSFRQQRNDAQPAPQPENAPQAAQNVQNETLQTAPAPELVIVKSIQLED